MSDLRLGFDVSDLDVILQDVTDLGGSIVTPASSPPGQRTAVVSDPDGRRIELTSNGVLPSGCDAQIEKMLSVARTTKCAGKSFGCPRPVEAFIVSLDYPGQGFHRVPPLTLTATCRRHRREVNAIIAGRWGVRWLQPGLVPADQVEEVLRWFFESSGLLAVNVVTPGAELPTSRQPGVPSP
jgi:hypothetical protein